MAKRPPAIVGLLKQETKQVIVERSPVIEILQQPELHLLQQAVLQSATVCGTKTDTTTPV